MVKYSYLKYGVPIFKKNTFFQMFFKLNPNRKTDFDLYKNRKMRIFLLESTKIEFATGICLFEISFAKFFKK